jgi:PAS domain S-box-containing protein
MEQTQVKNTELFEALATATPLSEVLSLIIKLTEASRHGMISSILLLDKKTKKLEKGAAPSLPDDYNDAVDGLNIGVGICSCGESAFTGKTVIVEDINSHPNWSNKDKIALAKKAGLKACWSEPIFSSEKEVIGTLAMYYREIKKPTKEDFEALKSTAHMAGIAIERRLKEEALQKSEEKFKTLFNALNDAVILMLDGCFIDCNAKTLETFKCNRSDLIGKSPSNFAPKTQPNGASSGEEIKAKIQLVKKGFPQVFNSQRCTKNGTPFDAEINLSSFEMNGKTYILGIIRDITERLKSEKTILESENKYRQLAHVALDGLVVIDKNHKIVLFNPAAEKMFDYKASDINGKDIYTLLINKNKLKPENLLTYYKKGELIYGIKSDKTEFPIETSFAEIKIDDELYFSSFIRNVSQEKQNEIRVMNALLEGQENERKRISKDLHDGLGQRLAAINMNLSAMRAFTNKNDAYDRIVDLTKETIQEYRSVAHALMPPSLRENTLSEALTVMISVLHNSSEIDFEFSDDKHEVLFTEKVKIELFRITQELINNAIKYSNASKVIIKFQSSKNDFCLSVEDNGIGFDTQLISKTCKGIGIGNIYARASFINGNFTLNSVVGQGTTGKITIKNLYL